MTDLPPAVLIFLANLALTGGGVLVTVKWLRADLNDAKQRADDAHNRLTQHQTESAAYRERVASSFITIEAFNRLETRLETRLEKIADMLSAVLTGRREHEGHN